jgi:hypothetical protein
MKRTVVIACVVVIATAVLAMPASALAAVKDFGGPVKGGGTITFSAQRSSGKYTKAGLFELKRVPMKCSGGVSTLGSFSTANSVNVSSRKFSYTFHLSSGTAKVSGTFNVAGDKATGTFSASGVNFGSGHTNCTTNGSRTWKAFTYL